MCDALSLADRDITTATLGPELCAQHGTSGRSFPTLYRSEYKGFVLTCVFVNNVQTYVCILFVFSLNLHIYPFKIQ